ncbi:MAG: APC family permease [Gammaproteobacteria bacterium]|nr:APC family permease [Gammaproteobacteria bacterium]
MSERAQLQRHLNPWHIGALALGCIIGFGCFVLPAEFLLEAGPVGASIGIMLGAALMVAIAWSYGVMVRRFPVAGGEFCFAYYAAGRHHAYVCGWFLALGYLSIVPLNATALAVLGKFLVPDIFTQGLLYRVAGFDVGAGEVLLASGAVVLFGVFNYRGAQVVGATQLAMAAILVGAVVLVGAGSALSSTGSLSHLEPAFSPERTPLAGVLAMLAIAPWLYVGFDTLPQAAEEFNFPPEKSFILMVGAILAGGALYVVVLLSTAFTMPWQELVAAKHVWPTGFVTQQSLGAAGLMALTAAVCMGIFTGINGFFMASSRLLFSMSRARILPEWMGRLHPRYGTPSNAILFVGGVSLIAPWFGRQVITWVVDMAAVGTAIGFFYTCAAAALLLRRQRASVARQCLAVTGALVSVGFLVLLCVPGMPGFMAWPSWVALFCWVALGATFYASRAAALGRLSKQERDRLILGEALDAPPAAGPR